MQSMVLLVWKTCALISHVTKVKQIFGIICGSKNTSVTTVSYIYITVPLSTVSSVNQYYALQSVQCTVKIVRVKTIHCATRNFLRTSEYLA